MEIQSRKADHIQLCLTGDVEFHQTTTGLERYRFIHSCLPELDRDDIDLHTVFFRQTFKCSFINFIHDRGNGISQNH